MGIEAREDEQKEPFKARIVEARVGELFSLSLVPIEVGSDGTPISFGSYEVRTAEDEVFIVQFVRVVAPEAQSAKINRPAGEIEPNTPIVSIIVSQLGLTEGQAWEGNNLNLIANGTLLKSRPILDLDPNEDIFMVTRAWFPDGKEGSPSPIEQSYFSMDTVNSLQYVLGSPPSIGSSH